MRHIQGYTWDKILNEEVPKTMATIKLLRKEKETEQKAYEKMNRKIRRR